MTILIGRDSNNGCLKICVDGGKPQTIKNTDGLSASVSKEHLRLETDDGINFTLTNLKDTGVTYVGDVPVVRYRIKVGDQVYMGLERQPLDWEGLAPFLPKFVDIRPLRDVWDEFNQRQLEINIERQKAMQKRTLLPALMMAGGLLGAVVPLIVPDLTPVARAAVSIPFPLVGILASVYFYVKGNKDAERYPTILEALKGNFRKTYVCPNPDCGHHFGMMHYEQLASSGSCPKCRRKFIV
ncbi:MAG: FHA domain-containing protein [Bacteroidaceae bacterium]|nr:FHA domain-containing protein [Bacteroidaceae bacterium]